METSCFSKKSIFLELFLLSAVALFFELLVIRWMSADIRAFTVFRTFPLASCFIGLGLGFALGRDNWFRLALLAILQFVAMISLAEFFNFGIWSFPSASVFQWQNLVYSDFSIGILQHGTLIHELAYVTVFMLVLILLLSGPFAVSVCIGSRLSVLFNQMKPLTAYFLNIGGSIIGSVLFTLTAIVGLVPWLWLFPLMAVLLIFMTRRFGFTWQYPVAIVAVGLIALAAPTQSSVPLIAQLAPYKISSTTLWSPYQRIDLTTFATRPNCQPGAGKFFGLELGANRGFYQNYFRDPSSEPGNDGKAQSTVCQIYKTFSRERDLPYQLKKHTCDDVLVVGAGTGMDVSFAEKHGVKSIDAVEIDPRILQIGKEFNPAYSAANVRLICDDARRYFNWCKKKYDLIVFGYLDSHTVTGEGSSVRVDAYVYTKESIQKALSLLKPDGVLFLGFICPIPSLRNRLEATVKAAAGYAPIMLDRTEQTIVIAGDAVRNHSMVLPDLQSSPPMTDRSPVRILTDDWPFLYVDASVIDFPYLFAVGEVLLLLLLVARKSFAKGDATLWSMFFLGSAFLLLEFHAISFLSLLFGATWVTSAVVINGILVLLLLANYVVLKCDSFIHRHLTFVYGLLLASLVAGYFISPAALLGNSQDYCLWGYLAITLITLLPLGLAGVIFASSFSRMDNPAKALSFNIFGSVTGALLEYLSNYFGIKALVIVAGLLYFLAFLCMKSRKPSRLPYLGEEASNELSI